VATCAQALGQAARAQTIMNGLAPDGVRGYGPAHLWQAVQLLRPRNPSPSTVRRAESHLLNALDGELEDPAMAHGLLGELHFAAGDLERAEPHLAKAAKTKPHVRLRLAQLYALKGDKERARGEAKLAIAAYRSWAKADLQAHVARIRWADAVAFLEDFPEAVA